MPVLLPNAIKDSTAVFGISRGGVLNPQTTPLRTPLVTNHFQEQNLCICTF